MRISDWSSDVCSSDLLIREKYGSLGSRLHREARPDGTTRFVGIAEWPDRATWQAAFDARMVYDEPATRAAFVAAIADAGDQPLRRHEVTADLPDGGGNVGLSGRASWRGTVGQAV